MKKRILSLFLAIMMLVSMIPVVAIEGFAAEETEQPVATFSVENAWAVVGSLIEIKVTIKDNPGILGATLRISWDEDLVLEDCKNGTAFSGGKEIFCKQKGGKKTTRPRTNHNGRC